MQFNMRLGMLVGLMAAVARPWRAEAAPSSVAVQPFSRVRICTPFGALITPGSFQLTLDADQSVKNALTTSISDAGVLTIGTSEDFQSTQPIRLTVRVPATALKGVEVNAPITSQVAVAAGFTPGAAFTATLSGSGDLFLLGLNATALTLTNNGAGNLVARGTYSTVTVTTSGAGASFITGGRIGRVTASASGVGRIVIHPTNADAQITGSTQLLGKIQFTRGNCDLTGSNIPGVTNNPAAAAVSSLLGTNPFGALGGSCQQVSNPGLPPLTPKWTCGLQVQGSFDCSAQSFGGASSTSSGPGGSGTTITSNIGSASTSTSGNGVAFAGTPGGGAHFSAHLSLKHIGSIRSGITITFNGGSASTSTLGNGIAFASPGSGQVQFAQSTSPGSQAITATGAVQTVPCASSVPATSLDMIVPPAAG